MSNRQNLTFRIGHPAGLQFEFTLDNVQEHRSNAMAFGRLAVWLSEDLIWGRLDSTGGVVGVEWYWIDLLEHIAAHWKYLRYEQGYPFGLMPVSPSGLAVELQERWRQAGTDEVAEDAKVYGFRSSHNIALALNGCVVPDLWWIREGSTFLIEARRRVRRCPRDRELQTLEQLGDNLCKCIEQASERRSAEAIALWRQRDNVSFEEVASLLSKSSPERLSELAGGKGYEQFFQDPLATRFEENRTLDLVYRCKGLPPTLTMRRLLGEIPRDVTRPNNLLLSLTDRLRDELDGMAATGSPPYWQGRKLALILRHDPDLFPDRSARADPEALLRLLGVKVERRSLDTSSLDALAVWGNGAQPWVILNMHDKHSANVGAERATLSHELCHLLVDRLDVLPLSAVVGGVMDRVAEQRANAFAAEFLCPRFYLRAIYDQWMMASAVIDRATRDLGVSNELAALQLARADCQLSLADQREIESHVSPSASLPWR